MAKSRKTLAPIRDLRTCFAAALMEAREAANLTQEALGNSVGVTPQQIGKYETAVNCPDPNKIVRLANVLRRDSGEWILLANLQSAAHSDDFDAATQLVLEEMRSARAGARGARLEKPQTGFVSLADFPFLPLAIVVGDKREEHPVNTGDLFAFSASTVDDRWIADLCLPPGTQKYSDKVFAEGVADDGWLRERFSRTHILTIGSPASNLFSRKYNRTFLFRFAISRQTERKWEEITKAEFPRLRSRADLLNFEEKWHKDLRQTMRMFKQPGFVDFNYRHLKLAIDPHQDMDFAVVSLGRNPFARKTDPYFAILVAGIHHPGTAHALRFLAESRQFTNRPFGGILEIAVPRKECDPLQVRWYEKIENSDCFWHSVGGESLEYTPETLRARLVQLKEKLADIKEVVDFRLDEEELDDHLALLDMLERKPEGQDVPVVAATL